MTVYIPTATFSEHFWSTITNLHNATIYGCFLSWFMSSEARFLQAISTERLANSRTVWNMRTVNTESGNMAQRTSDTIDAGECYNCKDQSAIFSNPSGCFEEHLRYIKYKNHHSCVRTNATGNELPMRSYSELFDHKILLTVAYAGKIKCYQTRSDFFKNNL